MFDYSFFNYILKKRKSNHYIGFVKAEIAKRLIDKLSFIKLKPKIIYIEGDFPDQQIISLKNAYPNAYISNNLTLQTDLILSNCKLHLTDSIHSRLIQFHSALSQNGIFLFTTFGSTTLIEIKEIWRLIDIHPHINQMMNLYNLGDTLLKCNFKIPVVDAENLYFRYETIAALISDIRQLKEPLSDTKMRKTFTGKKLWAKFLQGMKKNDLTIHYEIIYGYAKNNSKCIATKKDKNTAIISIDSLKKSVFNKVLK